MTPLEVEEQLWKLAEENGTQLTGEEFFTLLMQYADIFATSKTDLGHTDKLEHKIFTGDASKGHATFHIIADRKFRNC